MDKKVRVLNLVMLISAMICLVCYDLFRGLWLKGFTSSWFFVLGCINLVYAWKQNVNRKGVIILIVLGLCLGMCADVLLGINFMAGLLCFASGHVMYLTAFYILKRFQWKDVLFIVPIAVLSIYLVTGTPLIQIEDSGLKKLLIGYAVIIACMLAKALSNYCTNKCISTKLILIGSLMFWFSDLMLAIDMFGKSSRLVWILCSYSYWPAQNLLAHALYHFVNEQKILQISKE